MMKQEIKMVAYFFSDEEYIHIINLLDKDDSPLSRKMVYEAKAILWIH